MNVGQDRGRQPAASSPKQCHAATLMCAALGTDQGLVLLLLQAQQGVADALLACAGRWISACGHRTLGAAVNAQPCGWACKYRRACAASGDAQEGARARAVVGDAVCLRVPHTHGSGARVKHAAHARIVGGACDLVRERDSCPCSDMKS